jgi:phospholipid transport system substrate-binding protein
MILQFLCLTALVVPLGSPAAVQGPEVVVRELFVELIAELDAQRANQALSPDSARVVFARLLNPRIDYRTLARWILRDHWTNSTDEQRERFLAAFQAYIINTYSLALSSGKEIALAVEDGPALRNNTAIVNAAFTVAEAPAAPLQFRMIEHDNRWYLFDVSFSGVSLALTFRSDFNYVADEGGGIEAVTNHLLQRAGGT